MNRDILINCTIIFLQALIQLYNAKEINGDVFNTNAQLKLKFLEDNLKNIESIEEKSKAKKVIAECYEILSGLKTIL